MKAGYLGAALAIALAGAAYAQTATVTLAPADQTKVKEWIVSQTTTSIPAPSGFTVSVGAVVPQTVTLYEIPASVGVTTVTKFRYAKIGDKIVLVDPTDRKIVQILS